MRTVADRLRNVRWIGGGSGAGKSTVARRLVDHYGLRLYDSDQTLREHVHRSNAVDHPLMAAFVGMDMDERWLHRSPSVMLETFHGFRGEGFDMIVEDLLALPSEPPVLAEGFRLLPRLVAPLLSRSDQAVWLVPTPEFRRAAFDERGFTWEIPGKTSDPDRALANLLTRDQLFTDEMAGQAAALELATIGVDIGTSVDDLLVRVSAALALGSNVAGSKDPQKG